VIHPQQRHVAVGSQLQQPSIRHVSKQVGCAGGGTVQEGTVLQPYLVVVAGPLHLLSRGFQVHWKLPKQPIVLAEWQQPAAQQPRQRSTLGRRTALGVGHRAVDGGAQQAQRGGQTRAAGQQHGAGAAARERRAIALRAATPLAAAAGAASWGAGGAGWRQALHGRGATVLHTASRLASLPRPPVVLLLIRLQPLLPGILLRLHLPALGGPAGQAQRKARTPRLRLRQPRCLRRRRLPGLLGILLRRLKLLPHACDALSILQLAKQAGQPRRLRLVGLSGV
jgi:hypothetical protein